MTVDDETVERDEMIDATSILLDALERDMVDLRIRMDRTPNTNTDEGEIAHD